MNKYKIINDFKRINNIILHRIQALKSFNNVKRGDIGGWIGSYDNLSQIGNCWIYDNSEVWESSKVFENAQVFNNSRIFGNALLYGNSNVFDNAHIFDNADVSGKSWIYGDGRVFGNGKVLRNGIVNGTGWVCGKSILTKSIINITGLKFDISITDNTVQIGSKQWDITTIQNVSYDTVSDSCSLREFNYIKNIIKTTIINNIVNNDNI